uniref:WH2 domain-containing protein n=1 Tax=Toxocara canis TaxID=6265 RepID=A0A183UQY5_TOXCA
LHSLIVFACIQVSWGSRDALWSSTEDSSSAVVLLTDGTFSTRGRFSMLGTDSQIHPSTSSSSQLPLAPPPPRTPTSPIGNARPIPPPVAPKPKLTPKQGSTPSTPNSNPERMAFSSKLKKFEREIEIKRPSPIPSSSAPLLPAKKPLLNEDEVRKMKEEESKKVASSMGNVGISPADEDIERSFEHILSNSAVPRSMPTVVRTKKAENRLTAASASPTRIDEPLNAVEQRALEHQKRHEWRQARYKSLEADSAAAEEVMLQVQQINSRLTNISEESTSVGSPVPTNERILQNETSFEKHEYTDPITGAATVSLIERSITQREVILIRI